MGDDVHHKTSAHRLAVHQHLVIESLKRRAGGLTVRLRHRSGKRHRIRYEMPTARIEECFLRMLSWQEQATPLTYVRGVGIGASQGVLIDDHAFFRAAFTSD
jgi:hypothetical protein